DANLYAYALNSPVHFTDPQGLYGTKCCGYYQMRCQQTGIFYYCHMAEDACNNLRLPGLDEAWHDCMRKCLQDIDQNRRKAGANACGPAPPYDEGDFVGDHLVCAAACKKDPNADPFTNQSLPNDVQC